MECGIGISYYLQGVPVSPDLVTVCILNFLIRIMLPISFFYLRTLSEMLAPPVRCETLRRIFGRLTQPIQAQCHANTEMGLWSYSVHWSFIIPIESAICTVSAPVNIMFKHFLKNGGNHHKSPLFASQFAHFAMSHHAKWPFTCPSASLITRRFPQTGHNTLSTRRRLDLGKPWEQTPRHR